MPALRRAFCCLENCDAYGQKFSCVKGGLRNTEEALSIKKIRIVGKPAWSGSSGY